MKKTPRSPINRLFSNHLLLVLILVFSSVTLVSLLPCSAQESTGYKTVKKVVNIFSIWTGKNLKKAISDEVANYINYREMAERSLGKKWFEISPLERKEYVYTLRKLIEDKYYPRWHKILSRGKLELIKEVDTKDSLFVKTRFREKDGDDVDILVWQLSKKQKDLKVISIAVKNKDLLSRITKRIQKKLKKNSFDKLLAWMKDKADIEESTRARTASKAKKK